jgi:hypothetical protein
LRGSHVPAHFNIGLTELEGESFLKLLHAVDADDQFPLNEMEQQVLDGIIEILEQGPSGVTEVGT